MKNILKTLLINSSLITVAFASAHEKRTINPSPTSRQEAEAVRDHLTQKAKVIVSEDFQSLVGEINNIQGGDSRQKNAQFARLLEKIASMISQREIETPPEHMQQFIDFAMDLIFISNSPDKDFQPKVINQNWREYLPQMPGLLSTRYRTKMNRVIDQLLRFSFIRDFFVEKASKLYKSDSTFESRSGTHLFEYLMDSGLGVSEAIDAFDAKKDPKSILTQEEVDFLFQINRNKPKRLEVIEESLKRAKQDFLHPHNLDENRSRITERINLLEEEKEKLQKWTTPDK